jgi:hypothetical protein
MTNGIQQDAAWNLAHDERHATGCGTESGSCRTPCNRMRHGISRMTNAMQQDAAWNLAHDERHATGCGMESGS